MQPLCYRHAVAAGSMSPTSATPPSRHLRGFVDIPADGEYPRQESDPAKSELPGYGDRRLQQREHPFR